MSVFNQAQHLAMFLGADVVRASFPSIIRHRRRGVVACVSRLCFSQSRHRVGICMSSYNWKISCNYSTRWSSRDGVPLHDEVDGQRPFTLRKRGFFCMNRSHVENEFNKGVCCIQRVFYNEWASIGRSF